MGTMGYKPAPTGPGENTELPKYFIKSHRGLGGVGNRVFYTDAAPTGLKIDVTPTGLRGRGDRVSTQMSPLRGWISLQDVQLFK